MNYIILSWDDYEKIVSALAKQIKESILTLKFFDGICGIPRGGWIVAVSLSHKLNLDIVTHPTKNTLVVDDISDEGNTLYSNSNWIRGPTATLYSTKWTKYVPTFSVRMKESKESWIVFPWENELC